MALPGALTDLQVSPDGGRLAVAWAGGVRVLALDGGAGPVEHATSAPVAGVAFSPDGTRVAAAADDGSVWVLDAATGAESPRGDGELGGFWSIAWAPDDRVLAAGHVEPFVAVLDAGSGAQLVLLDPDTFDDEGRTATRFLPDGRLLSTAYDAVILWTLPADLRRTPRARRRRLAVGGEVHVVDLDVAPGGRIAALSDLEGVGALHVWEDADARRRPATTPLPGHCRRLRWLPDATTVVVAQDAPDGLTAWNVGAGHAGGPAFEGASGHAVSCLALADDPGLLYAGTDDGDLLAWDARTGARVTGPETGA